MSAALRAARRVIDGRAGHPTAKDRAYAVYLTVLVIAMAGYPAVNFAVERIGSLEISTSAARPVGMVLLVIAPLAGAIRGPAIPPLPFTALVVAGPTAQSATLRRTAGWSRGLVAGGCAVVAALAAAASGASGWEAAAFAVGAALAGWAVGLAWLLGQALSDSKWTMPCLALGVAALVFPVVGWLTGRSPAGWVIMAASLAAAEAFAVPRVLDSLRPSRLASQARRWTAMRGAVLAGDVAAALARVESPPRLGRNWAPRLGSSAGAGIVLRDLLGILRYPGRAAWWALVSLGAGFGAGWFGRGALAFAGIAVTSYFAAGGWARGLRIHVRGAGGSDPFGIGRRPRMAWHAGVPIAVVVALELAGWVTAVALGGAGRGDWAMVGLVGVMAVGMQAASAAKGPMPVVLLTPITSPFGDLSVLPVTAWMADSVLVCALAGGVTGQAAAGAALALLGAGCLGAWGLALWRVGRVGRVGPRPGRREG
ncbi:MAG: hypothetical protein LBT54_01090 [Bifidobacteriaceae bacterium]|nr:hypothetical protein [Bifidobacteriaceae bacterium]